MFVSSQSSPINTIQQKLIQYFYPILLIFGIIGCILNLIVFSRPQLRVTSCCICKYQFNLFKEIFVLLLDFFAASANHLLTLIIGIGSVIYTLYDSDPQIESLLFCKIRGYIFQITLMVSRWFIAFVCIDRYAPCSNKVRLRNFAKTRIAYRIIIIIIILWSILCTHRFIFYEIKENLCGILTNTGAAIYHSLYVIIGGGILPTIIMIICTLFIRENLVYKQKKQKCHSIIKQQPNLFDQQVLHLLFIQIICYSIFIIPQLFNLVFSTISTTIPNQSGNHLTIERFIAFIAELMLYMFPVTSFYLYTLTFRTFRNVLIKFLRLICLDFRILRTKSMIPIDHHVENQQTIIYFNRNKPFNSLTIA